MTEERDTSVDEATAPGATPAPEAADDVGVGRGGRRRRRGWPRTRRRGPTRPSPTSRTSTCARPPRPTTCASARAATSSWPRRAASRRLARELLPALDNLDRALAAAEAEEADAEHHLTKGIRLVQQELLDRADARRDRAVLAGRRALRPPPARGRRPAARRGRRDRRRSSRSTSRATATRRRSSAAGEGRGGRMTPDPTPTRSSGSTRRRPRTRSRRRIASSSRQYHPDHNPGDAKAEERFKEIQAAYDVVGDPDKRKQFDRGGMFGMGGGGAGGGRPAGSPRATSGAFRTSSPTCSAERAAAPQAVRAEPARVGAPAAVRPGRAPSAAPTWSPRSRSPSSRRSPARRCR